MKKIVFMLLLMPLFVACSDDDKEVKVKYDIDVVNGEWLQYSTGATTAVEAAFNIQGYTYSGIVYDTQGNTCVPIDNQEGFFGFNRETQYLRFSMLSELTDHMTSPIYELVASDDCNITLRDVSLNVIEEYSRIVGKHEVEVGKVIDNSYVAKAGLSDAEFISLNPATAAVDSEGNIKAQAAGITFILAKAGDKQVAVKVAVQTRVHMYVSYIGQTIDTILGIYGDPDVTDTTSETSEGMVFKNPESDKSLSKIQIQYDTTTRKVVRVLTLYNDEAGYNADSGYIADNYFWDADFESYFDTENFMKASINILPFEKDGSYYINYGDFQYLIENGHY